MLSLQGMLKEQNVMITNLQKRSENGLYSLNWFSLFVVNIFSSSNKKLNIFIFLQSLKLSAPVYGLDILYFEIPHWAAVFMPLCNPITYQLIMLESCSNRQKSDSIFQFSMKEFFSSFGLWVFVGDIVNGVGLGHFLLLKLLGPWSQLHKGSILLKCLLEARINSESFDPLMDFLRFLVEKFR